MREIGVATRIARRTVRSFAATVCVGEADARWLRRFGGGDTVHVIPNGVDVPEHVAPEANEPTLSFTGALDYQPNVEAVMFAIDAIWPRILAAVPHARFVIAGRNPTAGVRAIANAANVELLPDVLDMATVLGNAWVSIAPMRSGVGIKNKVLEAWACARPVVMSQLATNGLVVPTDHVSLVSAKADAMADTVVRLFSDAEERHRLGHSARENVLRHFTWTDVAERLDALLRL